MKYITKQVHSIDEVETGNWSWGERTTPRSIDTRDPGGSDHWELPPSLSLFLSIFLFFLQSPWAHSRETLLTLSSPFRT